jgi:hypothetical protein
VGFSTRISFKQVQRPRQPTDEGEAKIPLKRRLQKCATSDQTKAAAAVTAYLKPLLALSGVNSITLNMETDTPYLTGDEPAGAELKKGKWQFKSTSATAITAERVSSFGDEQLFRNREHKAAWDNCVTAVLKKHRAPRALHRDLLHITDPSIPWPSTMHMNEKVKF